MTASGERGEGPGTSLTWFNQATSDVLQCKQPSDPELGNLQATELWTVGKMVLRGKYICNYELKNLSNSSWGFRATSSCCWDSWGLCLSQGLPPVSSAQSSSRPSPLPWPQSAFSQERSWGCRSWARGVLTLRRWVSDLGREEKPGTGPSRGDADPACGAMGWPGSDLSQLPVAPCASEEKFPRSFWEEAPVSVQLRESIKFVLTGLFSEVPSIPSCGRGSPCCSASFKWDVPGLIVSGFGQVEFSFSSGKRAGFVLMVFAECWQNPLPSQYCLPA